MSTKRLALDNKTILTLWSWMTSSEIIEIHLHLPNRFCSMWKNDCSVDRVGKCAISQTRITCGPCQFQWKQPWTSTKLLRMKREKRQRRRLAESPVRWSWCDPWSASIAAFSLSLLPKKWITFTAVPSMQRPERQSIFQIGETLWKFSPQHFLLLFQVYTVRHFSRLLIDSIEKVHTRCWLDAEKAGYISKFW